jgi:hypothetical protein
MKLFQLTTAALVQTIFMAILFFANAYFFFADTNMESSISFIQIIIGILMVFGITALVINKGTLSKSSNLSTLQIISLIGLILFTLIATISVLAGIIQMLLST